MHKLNHRISQTADSLSAYERAVEAEIRRRTQLMVSYGIVSATGKDVDNDTAACALIINASNATKLDVLPGTVVFPNGEIVEIGSASILGLAVDTTMTDTQVVRLEYGEIEDGNLQANPYYNFPAKPFIRKKTPAEMAVVEPLSTFTVQPTEILARSVVLGLVRFDFTSLIIDNGRDTLSYARPWATPKDTEHRSQLGSGVQTPTNPHATSANDLTVGSYSMWQAMAGAPSCVLARPVSVGRVPGTLCSETLSASSFILDTSGRVTGHLGARYAALGYWPERLTSVTLSSSPTTEVAAWIPRGRNVLAVFDPVNFSSPVNLDVYYTKVEAGALPGSLIGLTSIEVGQPNENEVLVAGGGILTSLSEASVSFADVGLVPMAFDIMVGADGKVYKRPDCIYCNTSLENIGSSVTAFNIQPRVPTRLRVSISNYNPDLTEVRFQISGLNEAGANVTEQVAFTGPLPTPGASYSEVSGQRKFTTTVWSQVTQMQTLVRNGDGPNTTVTVFAEYVPERPAMADDLLLATVHWSGSSVSADYTNGSNLVLDRRQVSRGGPNRGLSPMGTYLTSGAMQEGVPPQEPFTGTGWATIVEDFADPQWSLFPRQDNSISHLFSSSVGARGLYQSRLIPFAQTVPTPSKVLLRLLPRSIHDFPNSVSDLTFNVTLFRTSGSPVTYQSNLASVVMTRPYPPYQLNLTQVAGGASPLNSTFYAAKVEATNPSSAPVNEIFQGFMLQVRD